jgi:hypothetical protein
MNNNKNSLDKYIASVNSIKKEIKEDKYKLKRIFEGLNIVGKEYFGNSYSAIYNNSNNINNDTIEYINTYTKQQFIDKIIEDQDEYTPLNKDFEEIAFDDAYRFSALLNINNLNVVNPLNCDIIKDKIESKNNKYFRDHVFSWDFVNEYYKELIKNNLVILHSDMNYLYFPLPSSSNNNKGGYRKTKKYKKRVNKTRKHRTKK